MGGAYGEWTYRPRIEPLQTLPVHREAQPCLQPPQWAKQKQCTFIPLYGNTIISNNGPHTFGLGALGGSWPLAAANLRVREGTTWDWLLNTNSQAPNLSPHPIHDLAGASQDPRTPGRVQVCSRGFQTFPGQASKLATFQKACTSRLAAAC